MALNKPTNAASNLLEATVTELQAAVANAKNRLAGKPNASSPSVATPQQVQDEADPATWATLQAFLLLADCNDLPALNAAVTALTPAVAAPKASAAPAPAAPAKN
jgi:hypothetical protein